MALNNNTVPLHTYLILSIYNYRALMPHDVTDMKFVSFSITVLNSLNFYCQSARILTLFPNIGKGFLKEVVATGVSGTLDRTLLEWDPNYVYTKRVWRRGDLFLDYFSL